MFETHLAWNSYDCIRFTSLFHLIVSLDDKQESNKWVSQLVVDDRYVNAFDENIEMKS